MPHIVGRLLATALLPEHEMILPLKLMRWSNANMPRPQIKAEWFAKCYRAGRRNTDDYAELKRFIANKILNSNLAHLTVHGTGFGPISPRGRRRLSGPHLMVQIVAVTEIIRKSRARVYKLRLSDGADVVRALVSSPSPDTSLGFYDYPLGYKGIDPAQVPKNLQWCDYAAGSYIWYTGWKVQWHGRENDLSLQKIIRADPEIDAFN